LYTSAADLEIGGAVDGVDLAGLVGVIKVGSSGVGSAIDNVPSTDNGSVTTTGSAKATDSGVVDGWTAMCTTRSGIPTVELVAEIATGASWDACATIATVSGVHQTMLDVLGTSA
jgi:hypothetical protein